MKHIVALLALVFITACATLQTPTLQSPLVWRYDGSASYESQSPGLGFSNRYSSKSGWIDVYVYSLRRLNWEPGVGDPQFGTHFESTVEESRIFERQGAYVGVNVGRPRDVSISGQWFRTVSFQYSRGGKPMHTTTYLSARNGQLLKYRVSIFAASGLDVDTIAKQFIEENLRNDPSATKV